jgi:hypothetical protein
MTLAWHILVIAWQPADLIPLAYVAYQWLNRGVEDL